MNLISLHRSAFVLLATVAPLAAAAPATTWYVSPCGNDLWAGVLPNCSAPLGPKRTIQAALSVASDGDSILLLPGGYAGPIDLDGKAVHLRGLGGAAATFIDGNGAGPVVLCNSLEGADTIIEGVTITDGAVAGDGGGLFIGFASPTIIDCAIVGNSAGDAGGGVAVIFGSPSFVDCTISGNSAGNQGGGVYTQLGSPSFHTCLIEGNSSGYAGGGVATSGGSPAFIATSLRTNSAAVGAGLHFAQGSPSIDLCWIESNVALLDGGGMLAFDAALSVEDSTLYLNEAGGVGGGIAGFDGSLQLEDLAIVGNHADAGGGVAAQSGTVVSLVECELIENSADATSGALSFVDAHVSIFGCTVEDNSAGSVGGLGAVRGSLDALGVSFVGNSGSWLGGAVGLSETSAASTSFALCGFYGNTGAIAGGAFAFLDGAASIESSILHDNFASSGGAIAVLTSSVPGFDAGTIRLRDSVLTSNVAIGSGGAVAMENGAALVATRCQFSGNSAEGVGGGAISAGVGYIVLAQSELRDNVAPDGGGLSMFGGTLVCSNTLFAGNIAEDDGGAFYLANLDAGQIGNCTIADNSAGDQGGAMRALNCEALAITNSIFWTNGAGSVAGDGLPSAQHSIVPGSLTGPGCFNANPMFVSPLAGDYRLAAGSPAIDSALHWLLPPDLGDCDDDGDESEFVQLDLDGAARLSSAAADADACSLVLDRGAYEAEGDVAAPAAGVQLGDLDGDGLVGPSDLGLLLAAWGDVDGCPAADFNGDGVVDGADLAVVLVHWS